MRVDDHYSVIAALALTATLFAFFSLSACRFMAP